ncbi:hypothetical protein MKW94_021025 [Papaver nudicaule]|uniref:Uncharacterized protein n=1 Tax=Papaver nudicaule TaxID=74823 RepID=A0AA41SMB4_PAPNU|nr:hypothetical protein [Papaver nudicaule]
MGMAKRRSPGSCAASNLLVMIICISIYTEMGSAWWPNVCTPGDTYIERNHINRAEGCPLCDDWCNSQCSSIGRSVAKKNCQTPSPYVDCQCCCKAPEPAPCSPAPPSLPPAPPSPPPPPGNWPDGSLNAHICAAGQEYVEIEHDDITSCALKPQCEEKCKEKGLFSAGSQCAGGSRDYVGSEYFWFEQCCCGDKPPPSPAPAGSCCGCCPVDINIQISITQGSGQATKITL